MVVIVVVLGAALVAGALTGLAAWRLPNFDPATPHAPTAAIQQQVRTHRRLAAFLRGRSDPTTVAGLALTVALILVLGAALAIGSLLVMIQYNAGVAHYDLAAARWGASNASSGSTTFLRNVSLLGGTSVMVVVAIVGATLEYLRARRAEVFAFVAVVVLGQVVLTNVTKVIVDRSRPDIHRLTGFSGASFPSGHAATAAATFAVIAFLAGRGRPQHTKALLAGAAAAIAVAVATTRVLLGVHWLTDVLAGLALGWGWFALCSIAFGGRVLRFGQPVIVAEKTAELSQH